MRQGGTIANLNGNELERFVIDVLVRKGYEYIEPKLFHGFCEVSEQKVFSHQVTVGKTIYDTTRRCDLIVFNPNWKGKNHKAIRIIECKWQESAGSVDEKYPFLVLNIKKLEYDTYILLDGSGYKQGAEDWLRSQVSGNLLGVFSMRQFQKEINKGFFD